MSETFRNTVGDNPKLVSMLTKVGTAEEKPVIGAVVVNLKETYSERYDKPANDADAITELGKVFHELIGTCTVEIQEGIGEYYRILTNRQLPAFEWMLEAFHVTSKKEDNKRNFRYAIGMLRQWMKYGFGNIPSREEEEVVSYFEEVTGMDATPQTRLIIQNLMGTYGAIKVTRMIGMLERDADISMIMAQALKDVLEERFPELRDRFS